MESTHRRRMICSLRQNRLFMLCLEPYMGYKDLLFLGRENIILDLVKDQEIFQQNFALLPCSFNSKKSHHLPPPRSSLCKSRILEPTLVPFLSFFL